MKALVVVIMGAFMAVFALAGIQTIEWCQDKNIPVPWQAYALLVVVAVWCVIAANVKEKDWKKADRFFTKLTEE